MRKIIGKIVGNTLQRSRPLVPSRLDESGVMQSNLLDSLRGKNDLPSIKEFLVAHDDQFDRGRDYEGQIYL